MLSETGRSMWEGWIGSEFVNYLSTFLQRWESTEVPTGSVLENTYWTGYRESKRAIQKCLVELNGFRMLLVTNLFGRKNSQSLIKSKVYTQTSPRYHPNTIMVSHGQQKKCDQLHGKNGDNITSWDWIVDDHACFSFLEQINHGLEIFCRSQTSFKKVLWNVVRC